MAAGHMDLSCPWTDTRCSERAAAPYFGSLPMGVLRRGHLRRSCSGVFSLLLHRVFGNAQAPHFSHAGALPYCQSWKCLQFSGKNTF